MNRKAKVIIFDFDGTLADTLDSIHIAVNRSLRYFGHPEKSRDEVRRAIGNGVLKLIARILPEDRSGDPAYVKEVLDYYNNEYARTYLVTGCYPGIQEAITGLVNRGYRLAILSNKPDKFIRKLTGLLFREDEIALASGQSDLPIKPNPASALMIASKLGVSPSDCTFVGDSDIDILTGRNAGMTTVGCTWGYRDARELERAGADFIIDRPAGLLELFPKI